MAADFVNNTTDYIRIAYDADLDWGGGDFTIMLWAKFDTEPSANEGWMLLRRGTGAPSNNTWLFRPIKHSGLGNFFRLNFEIVNLLNVCGGSTLSTGVWYHLTITRDSVADQWQWYINGVAETMSSGSHATEPTNQSSGNLDICRGGNYGAGLSLDGQVAHLRCWKGTKLTAAQIVNEMNSTTPQVTTNLVINMPLDLTTGTNATNERQDIANGTWTGTQRWVDSPPVTGAKE